MINEEVLLSVSELCKSYKDFKAVDGISFAVNRGEVFGLLGPNGAGKTTTIKMLCGLLKAESGEIRIMGKSMTDHYEELKTRIGLCPQEIIVWELLTCMEQLVFMGNSYGMSVHTAKDQASLILQKLGLWEQRNKLGRTLSGGMQRRLNMALALVHNPELIILDEPQAGLDPQSRILVRDYIRELSEEKTVILTTHDMDEADRLSDRVAIIDHGRILKLDTPKGLKDKSGSEDILRIQVNGQNEEKIADFINSLPAVFMDKKVTDGLIMLTAPDLLEKIPMVSQMLRSKGIHIEDMTIRKRTLEDAFIELTGRGLRE